MNTRRSSTRTHCPPPFPAPAEGAARGFTLIELMVVVVILGLLAAIAIPNFLAAQNRAREGGTRENMHTFQLAAEDYAVQNNAAYADDAANVASGLGTGSAFRNPYSGATGSGGAWEDRASLAAGPTATPGLTSYADSAGSVYNIKGRGTSSAISIILTSGQ